jgi:hypothetical protein
MDVSASVMSPRRSPPARHRARPDRQQDPRHLHAEPARRRAAPTGDTFSIRGFGTTTNVNTLVMLDGMPMNDPYFRVVDWNQIAKGQIEASR